MQKTGFKISLIVSFFFIFCLTLNLTDSFAESLTIYNDNLALIEVQQKAQIAKGRQFLEWPYVTEKLIPESVLVTLPNSVRLISQEYLFDLAGINMLLNKYLGKEIILHIYHEGQETQTITGTLLSFAGSQVQLLKTSSGSILVNPIGQIELPGLTESLLLRPVLKFDLESSFASVIPIKTTYLSRGFYWKADYVGNLSENFDLSLAGWVTIGNQSGKDFHDAQVRVVAGTLHDADNKFTMPERRVYKQETPAMVEDLQNIEPKKNFSYYVYDLKDLLTIRNKSYKQVAFLSEKTKAKQVFRLISYMEQEDRPQRPRHFQSILRFKTPTTLPKGKIRFYKEGIFLGSSELQHTPKNELVEAQLGEEFDLVAVRTIKESRKISQYIRKNKVSIVIRNRMDKSVEAEVTELFNKYLANIEIFSSFPYESLNAWSIKFPVKIPANGKVEITYTAQLFYNI